MKRIIKINNLIVPDRERRPLVTVNPFASKSRRLRKIISARTPDVRPKSQNYSEINVLSKK